MSVGVVLFIMILFSLGQQRLLRLERFFALAMFSSEVGTTALLPVSIIQDDY
jgi:hypothetical protein